jgi:hypothetical protein
MIAAPACVGVPTKKVLSISLIVTPGEIEKFAILSFYYKY